MPSTKKTLHFMSSALLTSISVGILGFAMSTEWATVTMECAQDGSGLYNGSATVELELFEGLMIRVSCPTFGGETAFEGNLKGPVHLNYKTIYFLNVPP